VADPAAGRQELAAAPRRVTVTGIPVRVARRVRSLIRTGWLYIFGDVRHGH
jgi:hypothetical protein